MKRIHLVSAMYASKGHGFEYIRNFCENLRDEYEIVLHVASDKEIEIPKNIKVQYAGVDYRKTDAENFVKYGFASKYIRALVKQYMSYRYYKRIVNSETLKREDLVYVMDYDVFPLSFFIKSLENRGISRTFLWVHNAKFQSKDILYSFYKSVFKFIFNKRILKNISGVVVNGEYIKREIIKNLKIAENKVKVIQYPSEIPFGIVPKKEARKVLGLDVRDNVVLFFGMLRKDKRIEFTIESVAKAKSAPLLIIAGSEASVKKEDIQEWIEKHQLKNYVLDIDYILEEKMALYYSCSDLLLLTYELESSSQSGPLSLAREFELPALVTNTGEIGRYVVDNNVGFTADPKKKEGFSQKLDAFFEASYKDQEALRANLKLAKERFSWKSAKAKYLKLFNV